MTLRHVCTASAVAVLLGAASAPAQAGAATGSCDQPKLPASAASRVAHALLSGRDVLGAQLLARPGGPSYASASEYLPPLFFAAQARGHPLTPSRAYYLPFGEPVGASGRGQVALHLADGSAIVSDRVGGSRLSLGVGPSGGERYGSCLARLSPPALDGGYLPILQTSYVDQGGLQLQQESFAAHVPQTPSLVSFLRVTIAAPAGSPAETVRFVPSGAGLVARGSSLMLGAKTSLVFGAGGSFDGHALAYPVGGNAGDEVQTILVARLVRPARSAPIALTEATYEQARARTIRYWTRRLASGTQLIVPDRYVLDAERNLLIQNLLMSWRYSLGNAYEAFEFPESLENAGVLGEYGFPQVEKAIVKESFRREPFLYPSWEAATRLQAAARYEELFGDRAFLAAARGQLARNAAALERQLADRDGLLGRERYTADLPDEAYGLPAAAVAWRSLNALARAWQRAGEPVLAGASSRAAAQLGSGVRRAVARSEVRLGDGSLFLPARLLGDERPYGALTATRHGSYWNLVIQDALASGLFAPRSRETAGALRYMQRHGSRLLGLVRADARSLYQRRGRGLSGLDEVYGLNMNRFLADEDRPEQLVLNLYGALAVTMTQNTFVSGEATSVAPLGRDYYRSSYLPPNSTANAAFLECLRLMLVHETRAADGAPKGLQLAFATPRAWLAPGKQIVVRRAPTSFGLLSFAMASGAKTVRISLHVPTRRLPGEVSIRLRRPGRDTILSVELGGRPFSGFDRVSGTLHLQHPHGDMSLVVRFR